MLQAHVLSDMLQAHVLLKCCKYVFLSSDMLQACQQTDLVLTCMSCRYIRAYGCPITEQLATKDATCCVPVLRSEAIRSFLLFVVVGSQQGQSG
eukprot:1136419-Pelagomonas_calceolata.AAC.4